MPAVLGHFWHSLLESLAAQSVAPRPAAPIHTTRELVRKASFQDSPQTCRIRIYTLSGPPGGSLTSTVGRRFGFSSLHLAGSVPTPLFSIFQNLGCYLLSVIIVLSFWKFTLFILHSDYNGVSRRFRDKNIYLLCLTKIF